MLRDPETCRSRAAGGSLPQAKKNRRRGAVGREDRKKGEEIGRVGRVPPARTQVKRSVARRSPLLSSLPDIQRDLARGKGFILTSARGNFSWRGRDFRGTFRVKTSLDSIVVPRMARALVACGLLAFFVSSPRNLAAGDRPPPVPSHGPIIDIQAPPQAASAELAWKAPAAWKSTTPTNPMRK